MPLLYALTLLVLLTLTSAGLARRAGCAPALLPLPLLSGAAAVLYAAGCLGVLAAGRAAVLAALAVLCVWGLHGGARAALRDALACPGLVLFFAGSCFFWVLFAVRQPMFTQWDEFTAWGLAPKMVVQRAALYVADPVNLTASFTCPGTSLVTFLFHWGADFHEWVCLAALDTLALACIACAAALPRPRWAAGVLVFAAAFLAPYFFSATPTGTASTIYANAMADLPLAMLFGGALCLYYAAADRPRLVFLAALPLALLALTKDIGFAYGVMAAFVMAIDRLAVRREPPARLLACAAVPAAAVLAAFLTWNRYTAAVTPTADTGASVGSAGLSYGAVLLGGVRQLLGIGREEKFAQIMTSMAQAFFTRRVCLIGSGAAAAAALTAVAAAAWLAAEKGPARRRVLCAQLALAFCFAGLYLFHLILYFYNFSDVEGLALKDYERYLAPYYQGWLLALLCLLGRGAHARRAGCGAALTAAAALAVFCLRGVPAAGFWSNASSLYTLRTDVRDRAAAANAVLSWDDRVLVLSQGDDATRWYYYKYELTAKVVDGYGGYYGVVGETADRWDGDFMNLVESENWTLYDYKAVCVPATLVAYLAEKDCGYLLIDRADDYLAREFSDLFEGGLTADMPATLYRFDADAAVPFTVAAVAEGGAA